ncbi:MAG: lysylphosphatidylglycerol synthase domain-containing protein, partial [Rhodothermia bacterium]
MMVFRTAATVAILGGLVWMIELDVFLNSVIQAGVGWLVIAALLLPVNIALEAWKWRALLRAGSKTTTAEALGSILAGYALGLFTPGRAGDYVGRILYLRNDGFQTAVQTGVDRVISMSVYVSAGLVALIVALGTGLIEFSNSWIYITAIGGAVALGLVALVIRPELFYRLLSRVSRSDKWVHGIRFMH